MTLKIFDPTAPVLGDMRVTKRASGLVYVQEYVPWGWEYTQLHNNQTLTSCVAELTSRGYKYIGRDESDSVYYYRKPKLTTAELMPGSTRNREALASIERLYRRGDLTDMDVFHLLNGNPSTGEE